MRDARGRRRRREVLWIVVVVSFSIAIVNVATGERGWLAAAINVVVGGGLSLLLIRSFIDLFEHRRVHGITGWRRAPRRKDAGAGGGGQAAA